MNNYTIKDIARLAEVGVSTVSRVINDYPGVKPETKTKILKIIEEYNYTPNSNAKSLKQLNSQIICIIVKGILNPFFSGIVIEIQKNIEKAGYVPLVNYIDELDDEIMCAQQFLLEKKGVGILFLGGSANGREEELLKFNKPCVFVTSSAKDCMLSNVSSVSIDDREAAKTAMNYLLDEGHNDILVIGGAMLCQTGLVHDRFLGILDAFTEHNLSFDAKQMYLETKFSYESAYDIINKFMRKKKNFTAIFAMSDIMAIGAAKCIIDRGLKVPEDISIVGFDGIDISRFYNPTLTTVRQPYIDIAQKSIDILLKSIRNEHYSQHLLLDGELIKGNSVKKISQPIFTNR